MGDAQQVPRDLQSLLGNPENLNFSLLEFPFATKLSFEPLYTRYKEQLSKSKHSFLYLQEDIVKTLEQVPELLHPVEDYSILKKYKQTVDLIMATLFPIAELETTIAAAAKPYDTQPIFSTPKFDALIRFDQFEQCDKHAMDLGKTYNAYKRILQEFYNRTVEIQKPMVFTFIDEKTKLKKYYKLSINDKLFKIVKKGPLKPLTEEELDHLMDNFTDLNLWMEKIPPENFEFHGLASFDFTDVTEQEAMSELRYQLLDRSAVITSAGFNKLQANLRDLFEINRLKLGLISFSAENQGEFETGRKIWNSIVHNIEDMECSDYTDSPYDQVCSQRKPIVVSDTKYIQGTERFKEIIKQQKIRSLIIAPLIFDEKFIGILELASDKINDLNSFSLIKVKQLVSLFSLAAQRSLDELESQIETIIREEYTAIHPTVAWKFENAANKILDSRLIGEEIASEPIVFENVYPLFGLSDIRGSSTQRNNAIKDDLAEHLNLAKKVVNQAMFQQALPILDQLKFRINQRIQKVKKGLNSGDEVGILEFIKNDVEPVFNYLVRNDFYLGDTLHRYNTALNADYGTLYKKRKEFEDSLTKINLAVSNYLEAEDEKAQGMFPHYFEKYKTDGVEYNIYVGDSIVQGKEFHELHLKNLRLWQLKTMCELARLTNGLKGEIKMPLETTHLILVQSNPLSIRFRQDEKKFDVDGAYNIRYEIVKKRIDKALIKDSNERLTQPGMIAIVYAQNKEAREYGYYIEYLQSKGYLQQKVEHLELEELQGASGLKALRVHVNLGSQDARSKIDDKNIKLAVSKMVS